jgi:nitrate reductase NapA
MADTNEPPREEIEAPGQSRREFLQAAAGIGAATAAAFGAWGVLELLVPPATASSWHRSVCRYCGTGCTIRVGLREGRVTDVRGDEEGHNRGVICVKGSTLPELTRVPGRLLRPKIRQGDTFVDVSWDEAMSRVAEKFKAVIAADGPDAVAFYGSGQLFTEESYTANKLFKAGIRTNNVDGNPRLCMASAASGYTQVFGKDEPSGCYEDIDHADCFFLMGANLYDCHPPIMERIRRRRRQHPETLAICVDPRRTMTARESDIHLPVIPGTDLLLLNAMAQVICADKLHDAAFIEQHVRFSDGEKTVTFADFQQFLEDYRPEKVADRLGLAAADIRRVAFHFARSTATMSLWTMGVNQRTQGTFLNNMLNGLHLITGQICRPGATPLSMTGQCNACGGVRDTGSLAHLLPGGRQVAREADRRAMEELWKVPPGTISAKPGYDAVSLFRAMEEGKVKAALTMCTNPAQSLPNAERYRAAMRKCFLVVAETFPDSETAKLASVLLPAALWIEKEGVLGQTERRYQLVSKLLDPPGEARSDLHILVDLADRLGHGALITARTPEAVWDEWRALSAHSKYNFAGITYERLRQLPGLQWPCPTESSPGTRRRYVGGDDPLVSPGARVEFYGQPDHRAVVFLRPYQPSPEMPTEEFPLLLTTGRVLEQWHTGTMTERIPDLAKASGRGHFELNEQDAFARGIRSGDRIRVRSRFNELAGTAVVTSSPRQGVLFAAFFDAAFLINRTVSDAVDPISREPEFKVTAVAIEKLEGK